MDSIKVHICRQKGRTNLAMRYVAPDTGKQVWRTAGTANHTKALKAAAVWEAELREEKIQQAVEDDLGRNFATSTTWRCSTA